MNKDLPQSLFKKILQPSRIGYLRTYHFHVNRSAVSSNPMLYQMSPTDTFDSQSACHARVVLWCSQGHINVSLLLIVAPHWAPPLSLGGKSAQILLFISGVQFELNYFSILLYISLCTFHYHFSNQPTAP